MGCCQPQSAYRLDLRYLHNFTINYLTTARRELYFRIEAIALGPRGVA